MEIRLAPTSSRQPQPLLISISRLHGPFWLLLLVYLKRFLPYPGYWGYRPGPAGGELPGRPGRLMKTCIKLGVNISNGKSQTRLSTGTGRWIEGSPCDTESKHSCLNTWCRKYRQTENSTCCSEVKKYAVEIPVWFVCVSHLISEGLGK